MMTMLYRDAVLRLLAKEKNYLYHGCFITNISNSNSSMREGKRNQRREKIVSSEPKIIPSGNKTLALLLVNFHSATIVMTGISKWEHTCGGSGYGVVDVVSSA